MKILFVDNHPEFTSVVIACFLREDDVVVVPTVAAAKERIQASRFDVVLVDYDLDDGKGNELLRWLRAVDAHARVIAVSARDLGNQALVAAGANTVCAKTSFARIQTVLKELVTATPAASAVTVGTSMRDGNARPASLSSPRFRRSREHRLQGSGERDGGSSASAFSEDFDNARSDTHDHSASRYSAGMQILLVDREPALVRAWRTAFEECDDVEVVEGDYFSRPAEAMVSPANSFGIMDGGLDAAIRDVLGFAVEKRAQRVIIERHHGELPVGSAELVDTSDERWPVLVVAPTMRIPENVNQTLNAYLAFRAVLLACKRAEIGSVVCCGLGTGIGGMEPRRAAVQMRMALLHATGPARIPSIDQIHAIHRALRTS